MSTFLLIHGGWHGGWCWDKVKDALEAEGHTVLAPDLPGHGSDTTPLSEVTLERYARATVDFAASLPGKVIAVGHSMTGISNLQAAEYAPEEFEALVFLAAFLVSDGQCLLDMASLDPDNLVMPNLTFSEDQSTMTFDLGAIKEALYADCSDEDVARAKALVQPQAAAPFGQPLQVSQQRGGSVPKYYIECTQDRAIAPFVQKKMYTDHPCVKVFSMDCSHSPFFSQPDEVARHLASISSS
ncbi:MAG: alpha/beta fold hydrolase [Gammaproteobacteria bacterium]|nr:alpha/beta fold hydrolase [Gammaproteobacteria bacterium]